VPALRRAVIVTVRAAIGEGGELPAVVLLSGQAHIAGAAAVNDVSDGDSVAWDEAGHPRPDLSDDAHELMSWHEGRGAAIPVDGVKVGVAHPAVRDRHRHIVVPKVSTRDGDPTQG